MARWWLHFVVVVLCLQAPMFAQAQTDWPTIVKPAIKQVVRIEMLRQGDGKPGVCSGVVTHKENGFVITAAHCVDVPKSESLSVTVNKRHAEVVKVNALLDLAVLKTDLRDEQQMPLADQTPPIGTEVAVVGHAFGDAKLIVQFGRIAQVLNDESNMVLINADVIGGDSGGAILDAHGRLVGITSRVYYNGPMHLGAAVRIEDVREFAEPYIWRAK